jgi:hypothetical protein
MNQTPTPTAPLAVRSYQGVMLRSRDRAGLADLWDRLTQAPGNVPAAKSVATAMGQDPLCASFHARKLREGESYPTGAEMLAAVEATAKVHAQNHEAQRAREAARPRLPWPECYEAQFRAPRSPWS